MSAIRVLLADDHGVVRSGVRALLDSQEDMQVVGEAADGDGAVRLSAALRPDVVVLDLSMPRLNGALAAERIRQECPGVKVLVLTVHEEDGYLQQAVQAGACGYVPKRAAAEELIQAVRVVARGGVYLEPPGSGGVLDGLADGAQVGRGPARAELSGRESEVLRLIAVGFSNKEIAARLGVSVKTVETHKGRAMEKLGLHSRVDLTRHAVQQGWLQDV